MVSTETQSILQRKAALGTQEQAAKAMSVARAMRQSIAKLGKEMFEMSLSAIGVMTEERKSVSLPELITDDSLLCLLEGDDGKVGAAIIGADIVGGLIQQQTMGHISAPNSASRTMTQTDAAMCAPLLDALFERVAPMLEIEAERNIVGGFRFGARFEDARALDMALDMQDYFVVRLTLDLAGGIRQGEMSLIVPKVPPAADYGAATSSNKDEDAQLVSKMNDVVMELPTELNMILCKISLELAQVEQLVVGETLALPHNTFPETEIVTANGNVIGSGVLGQVNGIRALRLKRVPDYVTEPRRREADLPKLDLPDIKPLTLQNNNVAENTNEADVEPLYVDSGDDLPAQNVATIVNGNTDDEHSQISALNVIENGSELSVEVPELDDFPDLTELTQVEKVG
jgi:flagellar motor switch protein FliM